jgi:hypothetical protein
VLAFEIASALVVVTTLAAMARARDAGDLARDYVTLAIAGLLGEESCIRFYRFYGYAGAWHLALFDVPLLVPLIWPLVVLSGRDVARVLLGARASRLAIAAATGALVVFDASLVEVVAVRAGLWSWAEPGHLSVPLIGILGWGFFAFGATVPTGRLGAIGAGLVATHALVLATWWGLFRWTARGDLGALGFVPLAALSITLLALVVRARRAGRAMGPDVWGPRVLAAGLFFVLLLSVAARDLRLWAHVALVAIPYVALTASRSPATLP